MNTLTTALLSSLIALSLIAPTAQAAPTFRVSGSAYNPETGDAGRASGAYNSTTGARYNRFSTYDNETSTYTGSTRAYNPSTEQGFTSTTTAAQGSGVNSTVNTVENGSYTCVVSQSDPFHCTESDQ